MKLLYIACAFDGGKSGISVYMRETLERLGRTDSVTVLCCEKEAPLLPRGPNLTYRVLPRLFNRAVFNMLYVFLLAGPRFRKEHFDAVLLPAGNRRLFLKSPCHSVGVVHDLSQYHVPTKYDPFRMFYVQQLLPRSARRLDRVAAISQSTAGANRARWP